MLMHFSLFFFACVCTVCMCFGRSHSLFHLFTGNLKPKIVKLCVIIMNAHKHTHIHTHTKSIYSFPLKPINFCVYQFTSEICIFIGFPLDLFLLLFFLFVCLFSFRYEIPFIKVILGGMLSGSVRIVFRFHPSVLH